MPAAGRRSPTSATTARGRCPAARPPAGDVAPSPPQRASNAFPGAAGTVLWPLYDGKVGLSLLAGPANAGKVALLLERYLARLDDEPFLIVPNASDVDRVERDLLARCGCLFSGEIGTFDDLFRRLVRDDSEQRPVMTDAQRALVVRRMLGQASLNGLARSARTAGFADALLQTLGELEQGMLDPDALDGDLAQLYALYRGELDRLDLWDRDLMR